MTFEERFKKPPAEERGTPFWAWNGKLDKALLKEQIDTFKKMGFGGFHIHSRIGLSTPYLGDEFMDCVMFCNDYGKQIGMKTWLYDEDKWPSGYGAGFVTENEDFRARYLLLSPKVYEGTYIERIAPNKHRLTANGVPYLRARYDVTLENGKLKCYRLLNDGETAQNPWYAYEIVGAQLPWFNNAAYVDALNPDAIRKFTEVVYERYKKVLGNEFSKTVPAIFTDEPQFTKLQPMEDGAKPSEGSIPYTRGFEDAFREKYGYSLLEKLPEVFWDMANGTLPEARYHCHDFISQRFADSCSGILGKWCGENGIMLTGHLMGEDTLEKQSLDGGDCMRSYPNFQLPGIDMLAGLLNYTTAKQAQSVTRQEGKPGVLSEIYGVTNWDYDFRGHKLQGDWQAALGITVRVPHLAWMCMAGESKRDYPAPIDQHSPWFEKYSIIEDHFARVNTVLRCGKATANVAVVHPIESHWMLMGPDRQCQGNRAASDQRFSDLAEWLLFGLHDFDYLSEGLLPHQQVSIENGTLHVGEMVYKVVVVPELITIRKTTVELLSAFQKAGGTVVYMGKLPEYMDGRPNRMQPPAVHIGFNREELLAALEDCREVDIRDSNNLRPPFFLYQMRQEKDTKWLFVCHGKPENNENFSSSQLEKEYILEFYVKGSYGVELLDTLTGEIIAIDTRTEGSKTIFSLPSHEHDSFLFRLTKEKRQAQQQKEKILVQKGYLPSVNSFRLDEPNTLLLDQAQWRLNGGSWQETEEILKIDDAVRRNLNMRLRNDSFPQPWLTKEEETKHTVELRFEICSEIAAPVELAFEGNATIVWNGVPVEWEAGSFFVDHAIHRISLPVLQEGKNVLTLKYPFGVNTNLEWCYLLGNFGVRVTGRQATITQMPRHLGFGSYHSQGLPFYGGNLVYETKITTQSGELWLEAPVYRAALLGISVDGGEEKNVFIAPYRINLGKVEAGEHSISIRSYGTRINQFGQVHNCNLTERYFGPKTWRTTGRKWCYEYRLKDVGVLAAPIFQIYQ